MERETAFRNLIAFYFGTKAAADCTSRDGMRQVSRRAYADLCRTIHGMGKNPRKNDFLDAGHQLVEDFVNSLDEVNSQDDFDDEHRKACNDLIKAFAKYTYLYQGKEVVFTYGQAQKWLNMALKYLDVLGHPRLVAAHQYLHVPVDKIVVEEARKLEVQAPRTAWSRMDYNGYWKFQTALRDGISAEAVYACPMDWEADVWVRRSKQND